MTRDQNIKRIRDACIAANPQIAELKFGCALVRPTSTRRYIVIEEMTWGSNIKEVWVNSVPFGSMQFPVRVPKEEIRSGIPDDNGDVWQVEGREPTLQDVLLTIKESPSKNWRIEFDKILQDYDLWNLRKGLYGQSDETLAFLAQLLG